MCKSDHTLNLSDIDFQKGQIAVKFLSFKHHNGRPITLTIPATCDKVCPVKNLLRFVKLRGVQPGPLFCYPSLRPVQYRRFSKILALVVNRSNIDGVFAPHGFRIGAATYVASLGYPDHLIQKLGRWKSLSWIGYVRRANVRFSW